MDVSRAFSAAGTLAVTRMHGAAAVVARVVSLSEFPATTTWDHAADVEARA